MKKAAIVLAVVGLIFAGVGFAHASVTYTVGGWGPTQFPGPVTPPEGSPWGPDGYPGDTVELTTYTGSLDLTPGTVFQKINTLLWTIDYTYGGTETEWDYPDHWSDIVSTFNALRSMSLGTSTGNLNQAGLLENTWDNDFLSFSQGLTTTFLVDSYRVEVTPLGLGPVAGSNFSGGNPWVQPSQNMMARFDVTAIPEPASILVWCLLGAASWLGMGVWRRKRAA